jgi:hypothetical protein
MRRVLIATIILAAYLLAWPPAALADATAATLPTSGTSVDRAGATAWTNPGNAVSDNATDTTCAVPCDYLVTSAYGFTVPTTATINGVTVEVEASETGTGNSNYIVQLISAATPTLIGNPTSSITINGTGKAISTSGGAADLWGATLNPTIVNGAGFGAVVYSTDATNTLAIDFVRVTVTYTPASGIGGIINALLRGGGK